MKRESGRQNILVILAILAIGINSCRQPNSAVKEVQEAASADELNSSRVKFTLPADELSKIRVANASDWLKRKVVRGELDRNPALGQLTLVAWKDPTLAPSEPKKLAAYAITDSLWASNALSLQFPTQAAEIHDSLQRLNCLRNNLHEVLFEPLSEIHHRSADEDIVHGNLMGIIHEGEHTISVRSFRMKYDAEYSVGHSSLFAEHAVYQALFDYWIGETKLAKARIKSIFDVSAIPRPAIFWDREREILVDFVTADEYQKAIESGDFQCRQFTFKLALVVYAARLMNLNIVEESVLQRMRENVWSAQLESGGLAHFTLKKTGGQVEPCPDATGEATAIAILSETILPAKQSKTIDQGRVGE